MYKRRGPYWWRIFQQSWSYIGRYKNYPSSMFLAEDTNKINIENSALGLFHFCAVRGRSIQEKLSDKINVLKYIGGMYGQLCMRPFVKKKSGKKLQEKTTGGCNNPLGWRRIKLRETNRCMHFDSNAPTMREHRLLYYPTHSETGCISQQELFQSIRYARTIRTCPQCGKVIINKCMKFEKF